MAGKSLLLETLALLVFALVITGLLHAIAWMFSHFNVHIDNLFLAAGAICAFASPRSSLPKLGGLL
jgi:hypothetical protein